MWLVVDALAVYRLAVLVTADIVTDPGRQWAKRRLGMHVFDFVTCPWCVSMWAAAGVVALTRFVPSWWRYPAAGLAFSAVAGFLAER